MILKDFRDYVNKLALENPHELYKEFVIRDERHQINYAVRYIDEGQNPIELGIKTIPDEVIEREDTFPL